MTQYGFDLVCKIGRLRPAFLKNNGSGAGQSFWLLRPYQIANAADFQLEYFPVQEQNRTQCLILPRRALGRRSRNVFINRQMPQELIDFRFSHFRTMAFVMKENKSLNPNVPARTALAGVNGEIVLTVAWVYQQLRSVLATICKTIS